ncbi:MAG: flagellar basal-body rod protein FlgF [Proteobacteria bacterium]|nr:flagellar basal-body rod protein FlgF [Pseudomonadota bacterium]
MKTPSYVALSQQMVMRKQMGVIANNIANSETPGYKADRLMFAEHLALPKGGDQISYTRMAGVKTAFHPGGFTRTGNSLDVAIQGDGFFVVDTPAGPRYTRNGHFQLDENSQLVTSHGYPVLGEGDQPIVFSEDAGVVKIAKDGTVSGDNDDFGSIQLVRFATTDGMKKAGGGLFTTETSPDPATGSFVIQGSLEDSNVEPILEITRMIKLLSAYKAAQKAIDSEHERQRRAIERLGRMP